ncbi:MAG TPA: hypothetical protein VF881_04890, partial [Polyangiaceae bacterium]
AEDFTRIGVERRSFAMALFVERGEHLFEARRPTRKKRRHNPERTKPSHSKKSASKTYATRTSR